MNGMLSWAFASSTDLNQKHFRQLPRFVSVAAAGGGGVGGDFLIEPTSVLDISSSLSPNSAISPSLGSSDSTFLDAAPPNLPPSFPHHHPCCNNDSKAGEEEEEEEDLMLLGLSSSNRTNCGSVEDFRRHHRHQWRSRWPVPLELGGQEDDLELVGNLESVCYPILMNGQKDGDDIAAVAAPFKRKESSSYAQKAEPPMNKDYGSQDLGMEDLDGVLQVSASSAPDQSLMKWLLGEPEEDWRSSGHSQGSSCSSSSSSSLSSSSSSKSGLAKIGIETSPVVPPSFPFGEGNSSLLAMSQLPFLDMASSSSSLEQQQQQQQQQRQSSLVNFASSSFSSEYPPVLASGCSLFDSKAIAGSSSVCNAYNLACKGEGPILQPCQGQHKLYPEGTQIPVMQIGGVDGDYCYPALGSVKNEIRPSSYHGFYSPQQLPQQPDTMMAVVELLLNLVEAKELGQAIPAHAILARLNQYLFLDGKPLQRVAFYFKEALARQLLNSSPVGITTMTMNSLAAPSLLDKFSAYRSFCSLSPLPQFSHFTLNQAILEAVEGDENIHLIDFDLGPGGQWASLLQELAMRQQGVPNIRMTVVGVNSMEMHVAIENLLQFARSVKLPLEVQIIPIEMEHVTFPLFRCRGSETRVINLRTGIRAPHSFSSMHALMMFLQVLERLSPKLITLVDNEHNIDTRGGGAAVGFLQRFLDSLQHHTAIFESLEVITDMDIQVEKHLFAPEIEAIVKSSSRNTLVLCRSLLQSAGYAPVPFSIVAQAQAEYLAMQKPGFNILRNSNHDSLLLAWQGRVLASASTWTVTNHTPA